MADRSTDTTDRQLAVTATEIKVTTVQADIIIADTTLVANVIAAHAIPLAEDTAHADVTMLAADYASHTEDR